MRATFWPLEAPDSLAEQSRRNPDGYGLATFGEDGRPRIAKRPAAAYEDHLFAREAKHERSRTFVAHVRYASSGGLTIENTHPFEQEGRVFAHRGYIGDLEALELRLGEHRELVRGDTDSERFFALITKEIEAAGGDVEDGIAAAVRWVARELPLFSLNFVLASATDLWAFRYPESHVLRMLERGVGGPSGERHLDAASRAGTVRVRSASLATQASVIFASERMDEDDGWGMLEAGELVHVGGDLRVSSRIVLDEQPARLVSLEDLDPRAAASLREAAPLGSTS
jgi:predicted glutamine amidotransferase